MKIYPWIVQYKSGEFHSKHATQSTANSYRAEINKKAGKKIAEVIKIKP